MMDERYIRHRTANASGRLHGCSGHLFVLSDIVLTTSTTTTTTTTTTTPVGVR
ncbi:MAG TPA: hypothetical protein H9879_02710 [Candidatus Alistipes intestinipullorum]|nr:hypothetical protein [Candidatus Alistipes intestinipullorum]